MPRQLHVAPPHSAGTPRTLSRAQIGLEEHDSTFRPLPRRIEFEGSPIDYYYLAFLDEVLDDMVVTDQELDTLGQIAAEAGLTSLQVSELHRVYLAHLESAALRDGRITPEEMDLIEQFAKLIGAKPAVTVSEEIDRTKLRKDLLICSTGTADIDGHIVSKDELAAKVIANGHEYTDNLTKKAGIGLLLVDSYGSQSGKVKNAVKWGIPIMSVSDYLRQFSM
jgi:DNA polymerase-3 subunit epsilon